MNCDQVKELLLKDVSVSQRKAIEEHLVTCPDCQAEQKAYADTYADIRQAYGESVADALPPASAWDSVACRLWPESKTVQKMRRREWRAMVLSFTASLAYLILLCLFAAEVIFLNFGVFTNTAFWLATAIAVMAGTIIAFKWAYAGGVMLVLCCGICLCVAGFSTLGAMLSSATVIRQIYPYFLIYLACFIAGVLYIKVGNWKKEVGVDRSAEGIK